MPASLYHAHTLDGEFVGGSERGTRDGWYQGKEGGLVGVSR